MSGQLHAGQLRYHDYAKLRDVYVQRLQRSMMHTVARNGSNDKMTWRTTLNNSSITNISSPTYTSERTFFLASAAINFIEKSKLKRLEQQANESPNDANLQTELLQQLLPKYPESVVARVQHPAFAPFSLDRRGLLLYLDALTQQQQSSRSSAMPFDLDGLLTRLQRNISPEDSMYGITSANIQEFREKIAKDKPSKSEQVQLLRQFLMGSSAAIGHGIGNAAISAGGVLSAPALMRGIDPHRPLHVQVAPPKTGGFAGAVASTVLGFVFRAGLFIVVISAISAFVDEKGIGRGLGGMTGSKHVQEAEEDGRKVKFKDVKGVEEAKSELEEIVMYLRDPSRFTRLGGKLPRGVLLTGPPGTGKTLLAKAIAGEAEVPFFYSSGSQFEEVYVGLGAKRVRELFEAAKKKSPAIIFIDEIDAVGGTRKLKDQSALKMTLNELLVQLDGFDANDGIIVIGATNFPESLDQALLRPGRFDKHVAVPLPDVGGRKDILEMYSKKTKLHKDVDLTVIARGTTGFSGADLYNLINQAAVKASIDGLDSITMHVLEYAKDKILMGAERKTAVITKETAKCTAYHEAGHALVAVLTDGAMPIHKATIMPRGQSLGMVTMLPEGDQTSSSYKEMIAQMDVAMGGRVAEELIFGKDEITSGASSDIRAATRIARNMVTQYGMSEEIGLVAIDNESENAVSGKTRALVDAEVRRLTEAAHNRAREIMKSHQFEHKLLAETLLEYETLTGDEVRNLVKNHVKPSRPVINTSGGARGDTTMLKGRKIRISGISKDSA